MSRRAGGNDLGSLELLLDTICNVFGSIILITLLVALMLTQSSKAKSRTPASAEQRAQLVEAESRRDELTRQLRRAHLQATQRDSASGVLATEELVRQARRFREAQNRKALAVASKSEEVGKATDAQEGVNELNQHADDRQAEIKRAEDGLAERQRQLDEAVSKRSRVANIPEMSQTTKSEQIYFLKGQQLYGPAIRLDGSRNTDQFKFIPSGGEVVVLEQVNTGVRVNLDGGNASALSAQFSSIDPEQMVVTLWTWNDSYEHFDPVRQSLEKRGIRYELIPMDKDFTVKLTNEDRGPRNVQ